jgi:hypothetical protein
MASFLAGAILTHAIVKTKEGLAPFRSVTFADLQYSDSAHQFAGRWKVDRGDAEGPKESIATFDLSGKYTEDWTNEQRTFWFCNDGMLYLVSRETDDQERTFVHPFVPTFGENGKSLTLTSPHAGFVLRMTRLPKAVDIKG